MNDLATSDLLTMYRHLKPLLARMEQSLVEKGAIHCPQCGIKHPGTGCSPLRLFQQAVGVSA